jgi:hypothetical protein
MELEDSGDSGKNLVTESQKIIGIFEEKYFQRNFCILKMEDWSMP